MSGSPQTDSGNWEENMKKEGMTKMAEAGAFYFVENRNRNIRYHSTIKTGMDDGNLERFTSATSFLPEINSSYTTSFEKRRNKNTYVNWSNGFTFALPKTYIRFSPSFSYSYDRGMGITVLPKETGCWAVKGWIQLSLQMPVARTFSICFPLRT